MAKAVVGDNPNKTSTPAAAQPKAPKAKPTSSSPAGFTATSWAHQLLTMLGVPATAQNVKAIVAWEAAEGGHWNNTAWYNPLNTTQRMAGSSAIANNDAGVQAYTSWQEGLQATVDTLRNGNYGGVLNALERGNDAGAIANAVVQSPWGTKTINLDGSYASYGTETRDPSMQGVYGSPIDPTASAGLTEQDFEQGLDASGFPKALVESIPELKKIFNTAIQGKWWQTQAGIDKFLTAVKSTKWYEQTAANQRTMEALKVTNPAEYNRMLTQKLADVRSMSIQLGIPLSTAELNSVALKSLNMNLDQNQLSQLFAAHIKFQSNATYTGQLGIDVNSLKSMAANYGIAVSDPTVTHLLQNLVSGGMDTSSLGDYFKQQAISKFPHLAQQFNSGLTLSDIADPYKQEIGKVLEQDPAGIATDDPLVMKGLQQSDGKGGFQLMPMWQYDQTLKQDPRWLSTDNAINSTMDLGSSILKQMGLTSVG